MLLVIRYPEHCSWQIKSNPYNILFSRFIIFHSNIHQTLLYTISCMYDIIITPFKSNFIPFHLCSFLHISFLCPSFVSLSKTNSVLCLFIVSQSETVKNQPPQHQLAFDLRVHNRLILYRHLKLNGPQQ